MRLLRTFPAPSRIGTLGPPAFLALAIAGCAVYANAALLVTEPAAYRFFPPFQRYVNVYDNEHLGGEYFNIAKALVAGEGFSHPFDRPTGPTAWQPPVLPLFLAAALAVCGSRAGVAAVVVVLQVAVLMATGFLVVRLSTARKVDRGPAALAGQPSRLRSEASNRAGWLAAAGFLVFMLADFRLCFQTTHDSWIVLLAIDVLIAALVFWRPFATRRNAVAWGLFGGLTLMVNPIVGMIWTILSAITSAQQHAGRRLAIALLAALALVMPWTVRNRIVFGRWIPLKANLAYELYQSQCLQSQGLLQGPTFLKHPYGAATSERAEYNALGETAYLDRKWQQFRDAVWAAPGDFLGRLADRFLGAALWYEPFDRNLARSNPWFVAVSRCLHPLPFLALVLLIWRGEKLSVAQFIVMAIYLLYLLPYIVIGYYERYALPLLGVKALLVVWALDAFLSRRAFRFAPL